MTNLSVKGVYSDRINGGEWHDSENIVTNEGIKLILDTALGSKEKTPKFYVAFFSSSSTPNANWNAASWHSSAVEITDENDGYVGTTRPEWIASESDGGSIFNGDNVIRINIKTTDTVEIHGLALFTSNVKGGNDGVLISATKYAHPRTLQNGDTFEVVYRLTLSSN